MVENKKALENLDKILKVNLIGIIGPYDLSRPWNTWKI